jgi:F-type H+-transporting ATPase subunit c
MDATTIIGMTSIVIAGITIAIGSIGPALGEGRAAAQALSPSPSSRMKAPQ